MIEKITMIRTVERFNQLSVIAFSCYLSFVDADSDNFLLVDDESLGKESPANDKPRFRPDFRPDSSDCFLK
jgi:hypothetical protein